MWLTMTLCGGCSEDGLKPVSSRLPGPAPVAEIADHATRHAALTSLSAGSVVHEGARARDSDAAGLWHSLAQSLILKGVQRRDVRREMDAYQAQPKFLQAASARATPYLYFIMTELKKRHMPPDLALLPILESGYEPNAHSPYGATGLWQFMNGTSNKFGLQQTQWVDNRLDIIASTQAALDYLNTLQGQFGGDWLLAIAAYNAGWGNIARAVEQNQRAKRPTDVWSIRTSEETRHLVVRLLALVELYRHAPTNNLVLEEVPMAPFFAPLVLREPTDLKQLVSLARIDEATFRALNPGFRRGHTGPSHDQRILVPLASLEATTRMAQTLGPSKPPQAPAERLAATPNHKMGPPRTYAAKQGDSLWTIARRYDTRVSQLEQLNKLSRDTPLRIGQLIVLAPTPGHAASRHAQTQARAHKYQVQDGDTLWTISRQFKITIDQLLSWNNLKAKRSLRPGQQLIVSEPA